MPSTASPPPPVPGPIPCPDAHTRPFWQAAARGVLSLPRCGCDPQLLYPPPPRCPRCLDETFEWVELSGRGRLWSWTEIAVPWFPGAPVPSVVAQVAPDEQAGLLLLAADPLGRVRSMAPGAPVRIVFRPVSDTAGIAEIAADDALAAGAPVAAESGSRASTVPQTAP
ncbi:MAG: OB-fold domain-containing protein [Burkholderiaceae bacterium]|nr:OB-fold domain-containing protein [Burkholderiaceae bacterium]